LCLESIASQDVEFHTIIAHQNFHIQQNSVANSAKPPENLPGISCSLQVFRQSHLPSHAPFRPPKQPFLLLPQRLHAYPNRGSQTRCGGQPRSNSSRTSVIPVFTRSNRYHIPKQTGPFNFLPEST